MQKGFERIILIIILLLSFDCFSQNLKPGDADTTSQTTIIENLIKDNRSNKLENSILEAKGQFNQAYVEGNNREIENISLVLAELYMETGRYDAALDMLDNVFKKTQNDTLKLKIHYNKASVYSKTWDYDKAIKELLNLRKLNQKIQDQTIEAYALNHIGVIYGMQKSLDMAKKYVNESLELSIKNDDYVCMANAYSNLASFCNDEDSCFNQYLYFTHRALHYHQLTDNKRYVLSLYNDMVTRFWNKQMQDSVDVYLNHMYELMPNMDFPEEIARIGVNLYLMGQVENEEIIYKMLEWFKDNNYLANNLEVAISYYYFHYKIEFKDNNFEKALLYYQRYKDATDSLYMRRNIEKINIVERNYVLESEHEAIKKKNQNNIMVAIIVVLILLLSVVLLILVLMRHKIKIEKASIEQLSLESKLDERNKEMVANLMQLIKVKETNDKIIGYLKENRKNLKGNQQIVNNMILDLSNVSDNNFWDEFNLRFRDVNQEFYESLDEQYPDLTHNERRICAFLYLDMTTKEIANITGQSIDSINLARTRLRKKVGLTSRKISINTFLKSL